MVICITRLKVTNARIVNLYEGILFLFREFWRPVADRIVNEDYSRISHWHCVKHLKARRPGGMPPGPPGN